MRVVNQKFIFSIFFCMIVYYGIICEELFLFCLNQVFIFRQSILKFEMIWMGQKYGILLCPSHAFLISSIKYSQIRKCDCVSRILLWRMATGSYLNYFTCFTNAHKINDLMHCSFINYLSFIHYWINLDQRGHQIRLLK